jgi:hypothetical protein
VVGAEGQESGWVGGWAVGLLHKGKSRGKGTLLANYHDRLNRAPSHDYRAAARHSRDPDFNAGHGLADADLLLTRKLVCAAVRGFSSRASSSRGGWGKSGPNKSRNAGA